MYSVLIMPILKIDYTGYAIAFSSLYTIDRILLSRIYPLLKILK